MQQNNAGFSRWVSFSTSAASNEEPSDNNVLRLSVGRRDSVTVLAHAFEMKLDSLTGDGADSLKASLRVIGVGFLWPATSVPSRNAELQNREPWDTT
jgi:hypothetical protein